VASAKKREILTENATWSDVQILGITHEHGRITIADTEKTTGISKKPY